MDIRWRERVTRASGADVVHEPWNLSTVSTGSFTPSPEPPPPFTAACFSRRRGRLTTNGLHLNLPHELSNRPGPPQLSVQGDGIRVLLYYEVGKVPHLYGELARSHRPTADLYSLWFRETQYVLRLGRNGDDDPARGVWERDMKRCAVVSDASPKRARQERRRAAGAYDA